MPRVVAGEAWSDAAILSEAPKHHPDEQAILAENRQCPALLSPAPEMQQIVSASM